MRVTTSSPVEATQVASIVMSGGAYSLESNFQPAAKSNAALTINLKDTYQAASIEATVGFIRANYDSLFRKLAE